MIYCERLKSLREDRDISQKEIAQYLHIAQNSYSQYETGIREPSLNCLIKICKFYNVSADYILGLTDKK